MQSRSIFKRFIKIGDTVRSIQRFQRATISRLNFGLAVCSFGGQFYLRVLPRRQWRVRSISVRPCRKNEIGKLDGSQPTTARGRKERGKGRTGDRVWLAGKQRLASFYQRIPDESTIERGRRVVRRDRDAISRCGFFYLLLDGYWADL